MQIMYTSILFMLPYYTELSEQLSVSIFSDKNDFHPQRKIKFKIQINFNYRKILKIKENQHIH